MDLKERIKNRELSLDILNAISTMSFPLTPEDYVEVLPYVFEQGDKTIKQNVVESLNQLPIDLIIPFVEKCPEPKILVFYFQFFLKIEPNGEVLIKILNNPKCPPSLFSVAANSNFSEVLIYLVNNVPLLQKHNKIVHVLLGNKYLAGFLKEKIKEYEEFGIIGDKKVQDKQKGKEQIEKIHEEEQEETVEDKESDALKEKLIEEAEEEEKKALGSNIDVSEEELDEEHLTLYQKLLRMTVAQKIDRALKGTKEERTLLIRDSNKVVAMAVIQSPKITEQEVAAIAGMRNVHKDVLRYIAKNRQFLKKYKIVLALVKNPKTPPDIALTLLNRLGEKDLKFLVRDRSISEFVRQASSRLLKSRKK